MTLLINIFFLLASVGLIVGIKLMGNPIRAKIGNVVALLAMFIAIVATDILLIQDSYKTINLILLISAISAGTLIGYYFSYRVEMTAMPQLVSLFNAFGGACAVIIGFNEALNYYHEPTIVSALILISGVVLGGVSFSGSIVAMYKLSGKIGHVNGGLYRYISKTLLVVMLLFTLSQLANSNGSLSLSFFIILISVLALAYGISFTLPIGGADMPVMISFLNAITGVATAFSGVIFDNPVMLIGGIIVGSTGMLLTFKMCTAMNRSLKNVLAGKTKSGGTIGGNKSGHQADIKTITSVEVASMLAFSKRVAIIPGFGMAVSQAQQACYEVHKKLESNGVQVKYIIHPVAGRMPGHMNVLLAEANIDYRHILEMDEVNQSMDQFDLAIIIGANDVVNPAAEDDQGSLIFGMPIIKAYKAKQVIVMKRGMSSGYSGETNTLFEKANCKLLFGDAKDSLTHILEELKKI